MNERDLLEAIHSKVNLLDEAVRGDGRTSGLVGAVESLQQSREATQWWSRTAFGAAIGAVVLALWAKLTGGDA